MPRCLRCRDPTINSNRLCAKCTCPSCELDYFTCGHRCTGTSDTRGRCLNQCMNGRSLCDDCTCLFETMDGRCSNPRNCTLHTGRCEAVVRGEDGIYHLPVMTFGIELQRAFTYFLLYLQFPRELVLLVQTFMIFSESNPKCISCRCNYLSSDGTRCPNDYTENCHTCSIFRCTRKIESGHLCRSHYTYACGIDNCNNHRDRCRVHGCGECRGPVSNGYPYCTFCSCPHLSCKQLKCENFKLYQKFSI